MSGQKDRIGLSEIRIDTDYANDGNSAPVGEAVKRLEFQREEVQKLIPTADTEVQKGLEIAGISSNEFGKTPRVRREKLIELAFQNPSLKDALVRAAEVNEQESESEGEDDDGDEEFYTPASEPLIKARRFLVRDSLARARQRLQVERSAFHLHNTREIIEKRRLLNRSLATFELEGSQIVAARPVSRVRLSPDQKLAVCGSWKGDLQVLDPGTLGIINSIENAHQGKVGGLSWNSNSQLVASGGGDNKVKVWQPKSQVASAQFDGHEARVVDVKFHPSDRYLASASFDMTWRLWDVETQVELQLQEGHAKEVYSLDFQCDGSLLCSAGLDSIARVWDLRSGQSLMTLEGHAKPIYAVSWSPNGHHLATGSGDGTVKVWDIRNSSTPASIMGHNNIVSDVQFEKSTGQCLVSSSYDTTIGVFAADSWIKLASLRGHSDKILSVDIARGGTHLLSCGWDRSLKKWSLKNGQ
ncbi:LADA_0C12552g1_1 [Lachancea dasiensis]|uniref:LADA_0C12552g1_1 n=1 Tax=Lachancea dasiensis TaxID=1072105 RepID=A0A1G4J1U6_9SACH|nr:LADA_0C12552g1_1 [Lachancea dasiensis]